MRNINMRNIHRIGFKPYPFPASPVSFYPGNPSILKILIRLHLYAFTGAGAFLKCLYLPSSRPTW